MYLDAIVTLVDARNVERHLDDESKTEHSGAVNEAAMQVVVPIHRCALSVAQLGLRTLRGA